MYEKRPREFRGAKLHYVNVGANGASSVIYDFLSLCHAVRNNTDVLVVLGVSGAIALPFVRLLSKARIITNVDGVEWKREKWRGAARWFLRWSERIAARFSHDVIADNGGIAKHIAESYGRECHVVAYGGDHALQVCAKPYLNSELPKEYALSLCRIEPENNVSMILEAFSEEVALPLVFIGNWGASDYGRALREKYGAVKNIHMLDPIYDVGILRTIRENSIFYVHGHSAGGTNPSLVEMMHFGLPIFAYDCIYNQFTTERKAIFFDSALALRAKIKSLTPEVADCVGRNMRQIARERYTWSRIGAAYFRLV